MDDADAITGRAAVLGEGTMGVGIAQVLATSGFEVVLYSPDSDSESFEPAMQGVERSVSQWQQQEGGPDPAVLERIRTTTDVATIAAVDVVIEAITGDLDAKAALLVEAGAHVAASTLLAANTSGLSITEIAARVPHPERCIGLHFFDPAPAVGLVEIVRALQTAEGTVTRAQELVTTLGKRSIVVDDRPGFLVDRVLLPYLNQAVQDLDEGLASPEEIDTAIRLGLGYPVGPFELLDRIGLDVHLDATSAAYARTGDHHLAPPDLLRRMVTAGRLGRESGRGFLGGNVDD